MGPVSVDDDYMVIATEFINNLSNIMGDKARNDIVKKGLHEKYSLQQVFEALRKVQKVKMDEGKWTFGYMHKYVRE